MYIQYRYALYVNGTLINYLHAVIIFENNIFEFLIMRLVASAAPGTCDDGIIIYNIHFNNVYIYYYILTDAVYLKLMVALNIFWNDLQSGPRKEFFYF